MFNLKEPMEADLPAKIFVEGLARSRNAVPVYNNPTNFGFAVDCGDRKKILEFLESVIGCYTINAAKVNWKIVPYCQED